MSRLFWKLFLALWLSIMGFAVLMALVNASLVRSELPEDPTEQHERNLDRLEQRLNMVLRREGPAGARRVMNSLPRQFRNHIFLFDQNQQEILGRHQVAQRIESQAMPGLTRELADGRGNAYRLVVLQRGPPQALLEPGTRGSVQRLLIAALVSALVSLLLARWLTAPMKQLGQASRQLAGGDLTTRIEPRLSRRKDEFGGLARDFNEMAGRLQDLQTANRRLLRDVSHELRSPIARLRVALEIARNRDASVVRNELDRIELESERLESLVGEVLDLLRESSETSPLNRESFELADFLRDVSEAVNYEITDENGGVVLEVAAPLPVNADRELLWRALENLLRNALLHTGSDGRIELAAVRAKDADGYDIYVRDSGPGIPVQHLKHIFTPFYRVQEARERSSGGHGLGLAIAEAAIRRHGGQIEARNRKQGGLEMHVFLPASLPA